MKTYILDLREQTTSQIIPTLIKNINYYFSDYIIYKEDTIYTIFLYDFNADGYVMRLRFLYTEYQHKEHIFPDCSLNVIVDYNDLYYNQSVFLQLIYSLFTSIKIYGIMEG